MSDIAIKVENLGKKYLIRHQQGTKGYKSLRDVIADKAKSIFHVARNGNVGETNTREEFWALKDVSLEIKQGEAVAIIGRNGAGKSTLLKLLSRITEPSKGVIELEGRVSSLLEVGTGFHQELTGRENIYLNGAILGMRRAEIRKKFDEIIAFAEVEKFLDTPVKRYSSGMYMRLAFAVAAHLEPDILVVDEVLAVGDATFQKKCLGKMGEVSKQGRTVIFVSHNMTAVEELTTRSILLKEGRVEREGASAEIVSHYLTSGQDRSAVSLADWTPRTGDGNARLTALDLCDSHGVRRSVFRPTEAITFQLRACFSEPLLADLAVVVENEKGQPLFCSHASDHLPSKRHKGSVSFSFTLEPNPLKVGRYSVSLALFRPDCSTFYDVVLHFPAFEIDGEGVLWSVPRDSRWGDLYYPFKWSIGE